MRRYRVVELAPGVWVAQRKRWLLGWADVALPAAYESSAEIDCQIDNYSRGGL